MKLLLTGFTAALLLLALTATDASAGASAPFVAPPPKAGETLQSFPPAAVEGDDQGAVKEEGATPEDGGQMLTSAWYKLLPKMQQLEQSGSEPQQLNYIPGLKESWNAMKGQMAKFPPEPFRETLAKMKSMTAAPVSGPSQSKIRRFMEGYFEDPKARTELLRLLLALISMKATSPYLISSTGVTRLTTTILYMMALMSAAQQGSDIVIRLFQDPALNESIRRFSGRVRQTLADLFGLQDEEGAPVAQFEEVEEHPQQ